MSKKLNIEAEGGELVLKNKAGDYVIIPKSYRKEVEGMINDGCYGCIDSLVETLPVSSDYAEDGSLIPSEPKKVKIKVGNQVKTLSTSSAEYKKYYRSGKLMGYSEGRDMYAAPELPEITVTATPDDSYTVFKSRYIKEGRINKYDKDIEEKVGKAYIKRIIDDPNLLKFEPKEEEIFERYASKEDKRLYDYMSFDRMWSDKDIKEAIIDPGYWYDIFKSTTEDQFQYKAEKLYKSKLMEKIVKNPAIQKGINKTLAFARKYPVVLWYKAADAAFTQGRPLSAFSQFIKIPETSGPISDFMVNTMQMNPGELDIKTIEDKFFPYMRLTGDSTGDIAWNFAQQRSNPKSDSYGMSDPRVYGQQFKKEFPGTTDNDFVSFLEAYVPGRNKTYRQSVEAYKKYRKAFENSEE